MPQPTPLQNIRANVGTLRTAVKGIAADKIEDPDEGEAANEIIDASFDILEGLLVCALNVSTSLRMIAEAKAPGQSDADR